jgi:hypothetical protein
MPRIRPLLESRERPVGAALSILGVVGLLGACSGAGSGGGPGANSGGDGSSLGGHSAAGTHSNGGSSGSAAAGGGMAAGTTGGMAMGGGPPSGSGGATTGGDTAGSSTGGGRANGGASGGTRASGGAAAGRQSNGGATALSGAGGLGGGLAGGGSGNAGSANAGAGSCDGPVGTLAGPLSTGIVFMDTDGKRVNAHGGGIIQVGDTFYLHGEYFVPNSTENNFNGVSMYSSKDLATWKNEGIVLPQQASGELGPARKGERPHIIRCPSTGEFVLFAHAASEDYQTDKEVVYATSTTVNGQYAYRGPLQNASGALAVHSDMSAYADDSGAYVLTESGHVYTLADDCHSWLSDKSFSAVNGDSGGSESPTLFKAGSTYYWLGSYKTGWRANNNFYSTAPAVLGPWTYRGFVAPVKDPNDEISDERTWLSQCTWVQPVVGCSGTTYVYFGDHWDGTQDTSAPGRHNDLAGYVFQPLTFTGADISMPQYLASWKLNVGAGAWSE